MNFHCFRLSEVQPDEKIFEKTVDILLISEIGAIALEIAWNKFQIHVNFHHYRSISIAETIIYVAQE